MIFRQLFIYFFSTGEILLSLILFGKDVSTGPRLQRWLAESKREDRPTWSVADDGASAVSPTSSVDMSDFSNEISGLEINNAQNLRVINQSLNVA